MVYYARTATVAQGKLASALSFAREIVELIKNKVGTDVKIGMPVGGQAGRIAWFVDFKDLAELDQFQTKLFQDPDYLAMVTKAGDNFLAGSLHDEIWRIM
jgi:hypothetical protein